MKYIKKLKSIDEYKDFKYNEDKDSKRLIMVDGYRDVKYNSRQKYLNEPISFEYSTANSTADWFDLSKFHTCRNVFF